MLICLILGNFLLRYNRRYLPSSIINNPFHSPLLILISPHAPFSQILSLSTSTNMCGGAIISDYVDNLLWPHLDTTFSDLLGLDLDLDLDLSTQNYPFNNTPSIVVETPKQLPQGTQTLLSLLSKIFLCSFPSNL